MKISDEKERKIEKIKQIVKVKLHENGKDLYKSLDKKYGCN